MASAAQLPLLAAEHAITVAAATIAPTMKIKANRSANATPGRGVRL
jgi:hypothetical protein